MSKDKRQGWLKDLKEGDDVFVCSNNGRLFLRKVLAITPTGMIKVSQTNVLGEATSDLFGPNGYLKGTDKWSFVTLQQATEEKINEFRAESLQKKTIHQIKKLIEDGSLNDLSTTKLIEIKALISSGIKN